MKTPTLAFPVLALGALLVLSGCAEGVTTPQDDVQELQLGKGGSGKPGTGSGPNATLSYAGAVTMAPTDGTILVDNKKKHETDVWYDAQTGDPTAVITWSGMSSVGSCSGVMDDFLDLNEATGAATVWFADRGNGTGYVKILFNRGGYTGFALIIHGDMAEGAGLTFSLTPTSAYADWPPRFATDNTLPETETCDVTGPDITADVDPN